ncbi:MAG TPA: MFS transporter [Gemmataceae bacterium]|nr:MFS transporter [Gemmataceae bacterium]
MASLDTGGAGPAVALPGAGWTLALLLGINLFNYIDRQVLSAVLPLIQRDGSIIRPDDPLAQFKLGLLTSAFMASYIVFAPLFGWLDGRGVRRWTILGLGVTGWSIASGCSGLAAGYWMLLATRCLVGIGEGAYAPIASAMLSDIYPKEQRGRVLAQFNLAVPLGSALGFLVGGVISDITGNWRHAFWATFSGLILGMICFGMKEKPRPPLMESEKAKPSYGAVLRVLARNRSFMLCCLGMTAVTFVTGGVAVWAPAYFYQRETRFVVSAEALEKMPAETVERLRPLDDGKVRTYPEMKDEIVARLGSGDAARHAGEVYKAAQTKESPSLGKLNIIFGGILVLGAIVATVCGAWLGERLRKRGVRGAYFLVSGGGALFALPCFWGLTYASFPLAWAFTFLTIFGLFLYTGPANTVLANVVTPRVRGTAFAINILIIHALGDMISPPFIGAVADASNLQTAFTVTSAMILLGGVLWVWGARYLNEDTAKAEAQ